MSRPEDDVPTDADFGIHEGEVDELERRWATRAEEQEENNRLVIQEEFEIEVDGGPAAEAPMRWTGLRRRRRSPVHRIGASAAGPPSTSISNSS